MQVIRVHGDVGFAGFGIEQQDGIQTGVRIEPSVVRIEPVGDRSAGQVQRVVGFNRLPNELKVSFVCDVDEARQPTVEIPRIEATVKVSVDLIEALRVVARIERECEPG